MQGWGKTAAGTPRYRCMDCKISHTIHRPDTHIRHDRDRFVSWLTGVESKTDIAKKYGLSRRALTKEFQRFFQESVEPRVPGDLSIDLLIVDGKYIHHRVLCVLVAVTENDRIFWRFAPEERYGTWREFLKLLPPPRVVVADGHKGMWYFVKRYWTHTAFQRCHFHMALLVTKYLTRNPKEEAGQVIVDLVHRLRTVKTHEEKNKWLMLHRIWEHQYEKIFNEKTESGGWRFKKLRSVRTIMRRSLPDLFTYLDHPGCPNTTNLVEGWVNTAIAEGLGRHRGLTMAQKKTLVSIVLSNLKRPMREKPTRKFP
jgi:hypothetical protein